MNKTKKFFNLFIFMIALLVVTPNAFAMQSVLDESGDLSEEEIIEIIESDEEGEGSGSSEDINSDVPINVGEIEEEPPAPTQENSIVQEPVGDSEAGNSNSENTNSGSSDGVNQVNNSQENPFSLIIILFIGIPIAVLLFFVIKKYIEAHKK